MRALVLVIASAIWLTGCAVTTSIVREEAADDLECPFDELDVRYDDERDVFHVAGCDLSAKYICSRDGLTPSLCRRIALRGVARAEREPRIRAKAAKLLGCDPASLTVASAPGGTGRYNAEGCGRRIGYECVTRTDCCALTTPGVRPIVAAPANSTAPPAAERPEQTDRPRGSLSKAHIREVIDAEIAGVRACYEAVLGAGPHPAGVVAIQFIIAPDGHVQVAAVNSSSLALPEVERCVVEHMRGLHFAKPAGGGIVVVTYPFTFETAGPYAECR